MKRVLSLFTVAVMLAGLTACTSLSDIIAQLEKDFTFSKEETPAQSQEEIIDVSSVISSAPEKEESKPEIKENLLDSMTGEEYERLNIFLSNFSEAGFYEFDRGNINYFDVVDFAITHNFLNTSRYFYKDEADGSHIAMTEENVDRTTEKYLGVSAPRENYSDQYGQVIVYKDGDFSRLDAAGAPHGMFTVAKSLTDNGDGTFTAEFSVFTSEDMHTRPDGCYGINYTTATGDYTILYNGVAKVEKKTYDGIKTYELIKYKTDK